MLLLAEFLKIRMLLFDLVRHIEDQEIAAFYKQEIQAIDEKLKKKRFNVRKKYQDRLLLNTGIKHKPFNPSVLDWS